jgi:hypothetical protein
MVLPVIEPDGGTAPLDWVQQLDHCTAFWAIENGTDDPGPMVLADTFIVTLPDANMPPL